ncbi:MAG: pilus assembly protein PilP [Pseudomonadota bacterium]
MKSALSEKPLYLKRIGYFIVVFLFLLVQGCLEEEDELILNQDGSGTFKAMKILGEEFTKMAELAEEMKESAGGKIATEGLLAVTDKALKEQLQGEGVIIENVTVEKKENKIHSSYTLTFNNIQNLLSIKAFQQEPISFYRDKNNNLAFQIDTAFARKEMGKIPEDFVEGLMMDFALTLPGKVLENNADEVEGNTLKWHYTQDKLQPEVLTAVCEGTGLPFVANLPTEPKKIAALGYVYDPTGKPDPFKPFILEASRPKETAQKPLHPLQQYEISQLKLVGIIWQVQEPRAILEDSAGMGYIISRGAYVGRNEGVVSEILENELIVTEKYTNALGETNIKNIRITLHGEEKKEK